MKIGIIVGRFQTPYLHDGHLALLQYVRGKSDKIIVFIGTSETRLTINNPLDLSSRVSMIKSAERVLIATGKNIPIAVSYINDNKSDNVWSNELDNRISNLCQQDDEVTLYGARESFIPKYYGKYKTEIADFKYPPISSTQIRYGIHNTITEHTYFREGVIWASAHKYPTSYQTVDVAITDFDHYRLLLGRKKGCQKFQFVGGFVDVTDESLEYAAKREAKEECGDIETDSYKYIGSYRIDDWRYRNETDKIMTAFFCCHYIFGHPTPKDDMEEVKWFDLATLTVEDIEPEHHNLFNEYKKYINSHIHHIKK